MKNKIENENQKIIIKEEKVNTDWLTRKETANYIKCSLNFLDTTNLPIKKYYLGRAVKYNKKELDDLLHSNCLKTISGGKYDK